MRGLSWIATLLLAGCASKEQISTVEPMGPVFEVRHDGTRELQAELVSDTEDTVIVQVFALERVPIDTMQGYDTVTREGYAGGRRASRGWFVAAGTGLVVAGLSATHSETEATLLVEERWGGEVVEPNVSDDRVRTPSPWIGGVVVGVAVGLTCGVGGGLQLASGLLPAKELSRVRGESIVGSAEAELALAGIPVTASSPDGAVLWSGTTDQAGFARIELEGEAEVFPRALVFEAEGVSPVEVSLEGTEAFAKWVVRPALLAALQPSSEGEVDAVARILKAVPPTHPSYPQAKALNRCAEAASIEDVFEAWRLLDDAHAVGSNLALECAARVRGAREAEYDRALRRVEEEERAHTARCTSIQTRRVSSARTMLTRSYVSAFQQRLFVARDEVRRRAGVARSTGDADKFEEIECMGQALGTANNMFLNLNRMVELDVEFADEDALDYATLSAMSVAMAEGESCQAAVQSVLGTRVTSPWKRYLAAEADWREEGC